MAAVSEIPTETKAVDDTESNRINKEERTDDQNSVSKPKSESEFNVQRLVNMIKKLNPSAKEFFPSYYKQNNHYQGNRQLFSVKNFLIVNKQPVDEPYSADKTNRNHRKRNAHYQGKRRPMGRISRSQRGDSVRRTVYVSDIDQHVTEERLASLFMSCGQVVDCRICGDPHSILRFAFVEFADEQGATAALSLSGTMLGFYPVRVLPSKTAILPVNPTFLPRSEDEREKCARTVYCTNIERKVSQADVKNFFEATCGEVTCLRLLGDQVHSSRIAFVEFAMAESAILALNCSGMILGTQPIRVSPSKTPVRPRVPRQELRQPA